MTINKIENNNQIILELEGRLDTTTAPTLEAMIDGIEGVEELVFDLKNLEYISSAGLRVLLLTKKKMDKVLAKFIVKNVCEAVMEVLEITGFNTIITIE